MIIFGTRGVTTTPERGDFFCPSCHGNKQYGLKRVRRFFTLYFIPVIPLDKLGEYVECLTCKDTFKPVVLEYNPEANQQQVQAEYHAAIKKVMIHMLLADGVVDDNEVKVALDVYERIAGDRPNESEFLQEIDRIKGTKEDFSSTLIDLQGCLNDEGKELVIKAALYVAAADGEFQDEEKELLLNIGNSLGMTPAHIRGVISSD